MKKLYSNLILFSFCFLLCNLSFSQNPVINQGLSKVSEGIYMLENYGCNIAVMVGPEGLLIIDSGYKRTALKIDSIISTISNLPIKYVLNTHFHYDHLGGNKKLSEDGAVIVAHENTRLRMLSEWNIPEIAGIKYPIIPPYPVEYLPKICFQDSLKIYFNNEIVQGIHFPNGHSNCDVIYYFQKANVIHTGDLFLSNGFCVIDYYCGGTTDGYIRAVDNILKICNEKTLIIPGHGAISNRQGLVDYRDMLAESRTRIAALIKQGKTVDEVIAADPTKDLFKGGETWLPTKIWVYTVYKDLSKK